MLSKLMSRFFTSSLLAGLLATATLARQPALQFMDLFNGKDLDGWVNVNTAQDTWKVRDGVLVCSGHPIGVMRTRQTVRELRPAHRVDAHGGRAATPASSSGATPCPIRGTRLPNGVEVQMLELEWPNLHKDNGVTPPIAYVHGELFGVGGVKTTPDNPRGERSMSDREPLQGQGRVEHLRRRRRRRRHQALGQRQVRQRHHERDEEEGLPLPGVRRRRDPLPQHPDHGAAARRRLRRAGREGAEVVKS